MKVNFSDKITYYFFPIEKDDAPNVRKRTVESSRDGDTVDDGQSEMKRARENNQGDGLPKPQWGKSQVEQRQDGPETPPAPKKPLQPIEKGNILRKLFV